MPNHYTNIIICSPGWDFNAKKFNVEHEKSNLFEFVNPMPEGLKNGAYCDWGRENWGTKWGTYDVEAFDLGGDGSPVVIKFQTAWSPPNEDTREKLAHWLMQSFQFDRVEFVGFDPFDNSTKMLGGVKGEVVER